VRTFVSTPCRLVTLLVVAVVTGARGPATAQAQEAGNVTVDSARAAAGRAAVSDHFLAGMIAGAPLPFLTARRNARTITISLIGAGIGTAAALRATQVDSARAAEAAPYVTGTAGWSVYMSSYRRALIERRRRALLLGILTGSAAAFFLFLPFLPDT
jgi:hypothetical protein